MRSIEDESGDAVFQPTLPARGATPDCHARCVRKGISTHAPRTGSDGLLGILKPRLKISTHAPRTGSDVRRQPLRRVFGISTHAPRTGSDAGGTEACAGCKISTHAPRTGSDDGRAAPRRNVNISTHAPRTGSDQLPFIGSSCTGRFQPTLPARGATCTSAATPPRTPHFNPRSPHGERLKLLYERYRFLLFQPTLPARGATCSAWRRLALQ